VGRLWDDFGFGPAATSFSPGYLGPVGTPWFNQGPTMIPTTLGSSGYPMAVAASDYPTAAQIHATSGHYAPHHSGGVIGRSVATSRFPRFHSGGAMGSGSIRGGTPQVHVYPVMDRRAIMKDMASHEGQKVIFDIVRGRRIDLGI
jgi:hypothetical protein